MLGSCSDPSARRDIPEATASALGAAVSSAPGDSVAIAPKERPTSSVSSVATQLPSAAPSDVVREPTPWTAGETATGPERKAGAEKRARPVVEKLFQDAGLSFPPEQVLFRVFKQENLLELWAASKKDAELSKVATYKICYASGAIGPKRREGDLQVPEGFYTLTAYTSTWRYHLMMYVDYPTSSDRALGGPSPGGDIYIHGNCASIGCISMGDERVEELWVAASALNERGGRVHLHVFPTKDLSALLASQTMPEHHDFWKNLKEGFDYFDQKKRLPKVTVGAGARYVFQ
jgi:hypothetical protein